MFFASILKRIFCRFRTDFEQNFAEGLDKGAIFKNWYYDKDTPLGFFGHNESPLFVDPYFLDKFPNGINGFHMCSALLNDQVLKNRN